MLHLETIEKSAAAMPGRLEPDEAIFCLKHDVQRLVFEVRQLRVVLREARADGVHAEFCRMNDRCEGCTCWHSKASALLGEGGAWWLGAQPQPIPPQGGADGR